MNIFKSFARKDRHECLEQKLSLCEIYEYFRRKNCKVHNKNVVEMIEKNKRSLNDKNRDLFVIKESMMNDLLYSFA